MIVDPSIPMLDIALLERGAAAAKAVARLHVETMERSGTATAFLISRTTVLTAYHVLFDTDAGTPRDVQGAAVMFDYAAGIDGLIVPPRNWLSAATVIRASAGASEFMPSAVAETHEAIAAARVAGLPIAVATAEDARPMTELELGGPLLLFVGGEKRGVSRAVEAAADWRVSIPYGREVAYSLGTAGAAAVLAFEILRQRRSGS